jgi:hypothetical protein
MLDESKMYWDAKRMLLTQHGLHSCFVPDSSTAEKNRIQKILQDANLKLTTYISDIFGVSGRALIESVINGEILEADDVGHALRSFIYLLLKNNWRKWS